MKRYDVIKTIELVLLVVIAAAAVLTVLMDRSLYARIAADPHTRRLCILLWALLGSSFLFLLYDFTAYSDLRRENLELDNAIFSDALTGIANRYSVDVYLARYLNQPLPRDMGCVTVELTNLSEINQLQGHSGGDSAIQAFSDILQNASSGVCFIGRNGGNKFLAIFQGCTRTRLDRFLSAVSRQVEAHNEAQPQTPLRYATGVAFEESGEVQSLTELVALSDRRAWQNIGET